MENRVSGSKRFQKGWIALTCLSLPGLIFSFSGGAQDRQSDEALKQALATEALPISEVTNPGFITSPGPDVTVYELNGTSNYGASGGIRGYSVGTTSCNIGDQPLSWCDQGGGCGNGTTNKDHPVIAQNMYRLKDGRFQQLGASWLKHGFTSLNQSGSGCGNGSCVQPPLGGSQLGVGCTDPYTAGLNGNRPLGRKSEVNAANGDFPFPFGGGGSTAAVWNQRLAVAEADLDPALNSGATYYIEGHYIAPDDATSNNGLNNASYRKVTVASGTFNLQMDGSTVRQKAAIEVWPVVDPTVELINLDTPSVPAERFHVARKVTNLGGGLWRYEYAIHNMNSDRSADRLAIDFLEPTTITDVGFHDVNAHSNEPYDTTDWQIGTTFDGVSWTAPAFVPVENTNALRWATMYNFYFDANKPPSMIELHTLRLFKTGSPAALEFWPGTPLETPLFADGFESGNTTAWN